MNNNGMIEYKENFITKIKNYFKRLFGKKEKEHNSIQEEPVNGTVENSQEIQSDFIESIKVDTNAINSTINQKKFLEEIKGNEEALKMLSLDRLKKLEQYYDSVIAEKEKRIKELKAKIQRLKSDNS